MILETPRTLLRPFEASDLEDFHAYASQPGVGEMAGWRHHTDLASSRRVLDAHIRTPDLFAVVWKENAKVIGHIGIHADSENGRDDTKELGFALHQGYQRKGIMKEVVQRILNHLASVGTKHIYACCFQENLPSRHLIEACGFTMEQEGTYYSKSMDKTFASFEYRYDMVE